jgi:DNA-binding GntR family transcriptional regulator
LRTKALPRSLADQSAEQIRGQIVDGKLQPGQALSETALAAELGVSKTPIREALLRLQTEGLVQILPQRGTFVFQLSAVDAHALSAFRSLLEVEALLSATRDDRAALAAALKAVVDEMKPAESDTEAVNYRRLDDRFHRCIIEHCGNAYLSDAYESIALLVQTLRNRLTHDARLNARSLKEHKALVRLIEKGDVDEAVALLKKHIAQTPADYAEWLAPGGHARRSIVGAGILASFPR